MIKVIGSSIILILICVSHLVYNSGLIVYGYYEPPFLEVYEDDQGNKRSRVSFNPKKKYRMHSEWALEDFTAILIFIGLASISIIKPDLKVLGFDFMYAWIGYFVLMEVDLLLFYGRWPWRPYIDVFMIGCQGYYVNAYYIYKNE